MKNIIKYVALIIVVAIFIISYLNKSSYIESQLKVKTQADATSFQNNYKSISHYKKSDFNSLIDSFLVKYNDQGKVINFSLEKCNLFIPNSSSQCRIFKCSRSFFPNELNSYALSELTYFREIYERFNSLNKNSSIINLNNLILNYFGKNLVSTSHMISQDQNSLLFDYILCDNIDKNHAGSFNSLFVIFDENMNNSNIKKNSDNSQTLSTCMIPFIKHSFTSY